MYKFSKKSLTVYNTLHQDLQKILDEMIQYFDITLICGYRDMKEQNEAYNSGKSKTPWPKSNHNKYPSRAVDIALYPINYEDKESFYMLAGAFMAIGLRLKSENKITLSPRTGADWDRDGQTVDEKFCDIGHMEVI